MTDYLKKNPFRVLHVSANQTKTKQNILRYFRQITEILIRCSMFSCVTCISKSYYFDYEIYYTISYWVENSQNQIQFADFFLEGLHNYLLYLKYFQSMNTYISNLLIVI